MVILSMVSIYKGFSFPSRGPKRGDLGRETIVLSQCFQHNTGWKYGIAPIAYHYDGNGGCEMSRVPSRDYNVAIDFTFSDNVVASGFDWYTFGPFSKHVGVFHCDGEHLYEKSDLTHDLFFC